LQMLVGVFLKFGNSIYNRSYVDFVFECIPQLVFMVAFFGYMDFLIMYKWVNPVETQPSIINSLICMGLGQEDKALMFDSATDVGAKCMFYVAICVPIMWLPKPLILLFQNSGKKEPEAGDIESQPLEDHDGHDDHEAFEFGECMIHQTIETIEYVLGTVSHTASYLRLWALSLAHQQLSLVFFQKTVLGCFGDTPASFILGGIQVYCAAGIWFAVTAAVLLGMDVLECFLHTLRLHWVEFQSKFYHADGYSFTPFTHKRSCAAE